MIPDLFESCRTRLTRLDVHEKELVDVWNAYLDEDPMEVVYLHEGEGVHILEIGARIPLPSSFSAIFGEWLYNARTCLDNLIWSTACYVSGVIPPPSEERIQYPIYDSKDAWKANLDRLSGLADHHREMLLVMQPFNSNTDANYLGVINRLSRIDRHRRLTQGSAVLGVLNPIVEAPDHCEIHIELGDRVLRNGSTRAARITVRPWANGMNTRVNPQAGLDPEIVEWASSAYWARMPFAERLRMIRLFIEAEIAVYEYDCTGSCARPEMLTEGFRASSDARGHYREPRGSTSEVSWSEPTKADKVSPQLFFEGE